MIKILIIILMSSCTQIKILKSSDKNADDKFIISKNTKNQNHTEVKNSQKIINFCSKVDKKFKTLNWGKSNCNQYQWNSVRNSHFGNPIMWTEFNRDNSNKTTIILCGVHPDEITPIKFCFDLLDDLKKNPDIYQNSKVVIAPIVTTDPFFYDSPTRTNSRKIDTNRNFPTKDWQAKALSLWRTKYKSNPRRFPGLNANSEQETIFQVNLIKLFKPDYIVSVHAPLKLLDYDGPSLTTKKSKAVKEILNQMSNKAGNYKVANYPFYPGSLGNWAGNERNIPTFTLELPDSDWNKTDKYFKIFSPAVYHLFHDQKK